MTKKRLLALVLALVLVVGLVPTVWADEPTEPETEPLVTDATEEGTEESDDVAAIAEGDGDDGNNTDGGDDDDGAGSDDGDEEGGGGAGEQDPDALKDNTYIETSKTYTYDEAVEEYTLILESYLEGMPTTTTNEKIASDIVLVLDQSGSMNYCFYCGVKEANSRSNHKAYASSVNTSTEYWTNTEKGSQLYYCSDYCKVWFTTEDHSKHAGKEGYLPTATANDATRDAYYFYSAKKTSAKVIAANLDFSKTYYWKDGDTYKEVKYCTECARWYSGHSHNEDGSVKKAGEQRYPEISLDFEVHYQPFYYACSEREAALREALNKFVNQVTTVSDEDNVHNRLAIVGFGSDVSSANDTPASNEILSSKADAKDGYNKEVFPVWYGLIDTADERNSTKGTRYLQSALQDMTTAEGKAMIEYALSEYKIKGNTWTGHGMKMAYWILEKATATDHNNDGKADTRNKVIILFTDGYPYRKNTDTTTYGYFGAQANDAIKYASNATKDFGATVYTIGIFAGADGTGSLPANSGSNNGSNVNKANRFMQLVSSNYPNATSLDSAGSKNPDLKTGESYYLSPSTTDALSEVFSKIATDITSGGAYIKEMDENTVVQDQISPYFQIAEGASSVKAYTQSFAGMVGDVATWTTNDELTSDSGVLKISIADDGIVQVSGFDFAENYVATDMVDDQEYPRGKKLVLEIKIKVNPDFLGGDSIMTNTTESGIFIGNELVEQFELPQTSVKLKQITPEFKNGAIYVSQAAVLPHIANIGHFTVDDGQSYTIDGINNAYVDIIYTITNNGKSFSYTVPAGTKYEELSIKFGENWCDADGNPMTDDDIYAQLTKDTKYQITCNVISKNDNTNSKSVKGEASILVYKPEITFKDSSADLGAEVDLNKNLVSVVWKHGETVADTTVMGSAPTLMFRFYNPSTFVKAEQEGTQFDYAQNETALYEGDKMTVNAETPVLVEVISLTNTRDDHHRVPYDTNITQYTTFYRQACDFAGCGNTATTTVVTTGDSWVNFVVHPNCFDLIIKKTGWEEIDENQTFIFRVTNDKGFAMDVVITGVRGEVTIKNLPVAKYTVTEITDWSWRYEPEDDSVEVNPDEPTETVEFKNTRNKIQWLSGDNSAKNWWGEFANNS